MVSGYIRTNGDSITVTITYSSFNQQLIDELEEKFNKTIKTYQLLTIPDDSVRIEELEKQTKTEDN